MANSLNATFFEPDGLVVGVADAETSLSICRAANRYAVWLERLSSRGTNVATMSRQQGRQDVAACLCRLVMTRLDAGDAAWPPRRLEPSMPGVRSRWRRRFR